MTEKEDNMKIQGEQPQSIDDVVISEDLFRSNSMTYDSASPPAEASKEKCNAVVQGLLKIKDFQTKKVGNNNLAHTLIAVSILLQKGATSVKANSQQRIEFGNAKVSIGNLRDECRAQGITVRQFARGMKDKVIDVMNRMGSFAPKGNLAKKAELELGDLSQQDLIWCSDFQTYNEK